MLNPLTALNQLFDLEMAVFAEPFAPGDDVELTAPSGRVYVGSVLETDGDMIFVQYIASWEDRSFVTTGWWHVSSAVKLAQ